MYSPKNPRIVEPPTKKLKLLTAASFAAFAVLCVLVIVLGLQIITKNNALQHKQDDITLLSDTLTKSIDELTKAKRALIVTTAIPPYESFNAQCPGGNKEDGLFTPMSDTPIEGYNVILVECRSTLSKGVASPRILVFRVNNDGSKELTYGSNENEPLCISNKVPVANKIAIKLNLPVCSSL